MCGFLAILHESPRREISDYRRALNALTHRGPDAVGEFCDDGVFLGHRRLSIIDLETGGQPMQSSDGRYVIVFNGEIYNFQDLQQQLDRDGAKFTSRSDTEVILEGYRRWGSDVVDHLHGMFAFVIWDRVRRIGFIARDRMGIKPLCWAMQNSSLIISSTIEPFHILLGPNRQLDLVSIRDLMTFDYIPVPGSIYKDVHKLEPGSCFEWFVGDREPKIRRYWTPPLADQSAKIPDEFELEHLFDESVKRQMISDVPIGAFLSGGIDSSLIVAMMARHTSRVRTFSVGFNDGVDESPIAQRVASQFGTEHTVLHTEEFGAEELLDLIGRLDEPFCDPTFVPTYTLSEMTKRYVKVALSGDGGDEVFGGYPKYLWRENGRKRLPFSSLCHGALAKFPWRPRGMGHIYPHTLSTREFFRFTWSRYGDFPVFRKDLRQLLRSPYQEGSKIADYFEPWERRAHRYGTNLDMDTLMRTDLETYLSENCLVKTDRASMLASLEVRVPYLDEALLDRILPLPAATKIVNGQLKALFTPLARRLLPREVWDRPKQGFDVPVDARLAGAWRPAVDEVLDWGKKHFALFDYSYLRRLEMINRSEGGIDRELWNPVVMIAWAKARSLVI